MMISFGPHTQGVFHQVGGGHRALAFDVRRARFEAHDVLLLKLKLGRVLDRDDALAVRNEAGQRIEQRRFTGAGAAGDDHVEAGLDAAFEQHHHLRREGLEVEQVFELERVGAEAANRNRGAVERQRRNDRVHTAAVRQAGIDHRADFVHAAADLRHDAVDDLHQVSVVAEHDAGFFHLAAAFDVDVLWAVDQDIADRMVLEQHLERAEAEGFIEHFLDEPVAFAAVEEVILGIAEVLDDQADFAAEHVALKFADSRQVKLVHQLGVDASLERFEVAALVLFARAERRCGFGGGITSIQPVRVSRVGRCDGTFGAGRGVDVWVFGPASNENIAHVKCAL